MIYRSGIATNLYHFLQLFTTLYNPLPFFTNLYPLPYHPLPFFTNLYPLPYHPLPFFTNLYPLPYHPLPYFTILHPLPYHPLTIFYNSLPITTLYHFLQIFTFESITNNNEPTSPFIVILSEVEGHP